MKIYIAGPMRGLPEFNYPAFYSAAEFIEANGNEPVNPAEFGKAYGTPEMISSDNDLLSALIEDELRLLEGCDAVYLLRGWENSVGARGELSLALKLNLKIIVQA